ncbi:hypothetical protein [Fluviicola chungangensis]|uniref:Uncharacterized protein n=1 Tax=Fluviicola chungangensis TaxID=2597671 RepID=A0A556MPV7_9FLAO|nr:hypothetical protein [Fluviicola chungangensis]TSJ41862.1 hypothetical protein FO442_12275 [Fluviicola chungangensis]
MIKYLLIFIPFISFSQGDWEKVDPQVFVEVLRTFEKTIAEGESYSFETHYSIYNDHKDQTPVKQFKGSLICKSGKELNVRQMGQLMIQNPAMNLTIDTVSKQLVIQQADPSFFYRKTVDDYLKFSEMAEGIYRKKLVEQDVYILELKKGFPYKSMEITVTKQGTITQVIIYSNQPYQVDNTDYSNARAKIVMDMRDFRKGKSVDFKGFLTIGDFIKQEREKLIPTGSYSHYELIDLRN